MGRHVKRGELRSRIADTRRMWDVLVVGGGATGLGAAVDAAARGYAALLLERDDFAKGTSSRSTKLIHGGVRYLKQGHIGLVREALHERGILRRTAPHLVRDLGFVVPAYDWWEGPFYGIGFKLYDALAGELGLGPSRLLSVGETLERIPTVAREGLRGGVIYHDAQFDDARLAVTLVLTLLDLGGTPVNYMEVTDLLKTGGRVAGVRARDALTGEDIELRARTVINATGVFCDRLRRRDRPDAAPLVTASQGIHLVLPRRFLPGDSAIMVPHTEDGRVLFAVPWQDRVLLGTTDTPVPEPDPEPAPFPEEIAFLLRHAARYLAHAPEPEDVLCAFAGLRPLFNAAPGASTAALSREHAIEVAESGLVTITGGKWTTYRRMGQDVIDRALGTERASATEELRLHGWTDGDGAPGLAEYGTDAAQVLALAKEDPSLAAPLHPRLPYRRAQVVWAARREMAMTVEDVLARRTRALLLDARASADAAPAVADLLARELGRDDAWKAGQIASYRDLVRRHLVAPAS